ncbi:uncharacterized protein CANTADRAFT_26887 [Suhomyces tanzawaensis NRRL Y-17324]|uniref:SET domain-containing protein n=1 Tax=Suhomyces tanzawaensis NRRL Y-17324 TaxID=984487 RepID=A0A1E4SEG9_9ASCO|nr:uncharacterized protein CANTADRAFT_26887 [Suhomyces tanzawaensis NRRL Y-17324]ODV77870.1 hypothetical protein CANTADRAFT_26887 [Suhomyces tanzawaensis NRRL Y-17324]
MSNTVAQNIDSLKGWLEKNAFWRNELIIRPSKYGGIGVFAPDQMDYEDPLLLRIPKTSVLSAKNSLIYNLLVDYKYEEVDISTGMYGVIISVIYELSAGTKSPWYEYLNSIDFENSSVPVCLWDQDDKDNFKNTEVDLLNLLNPDELIQFYQECIKFAKASSQYVAIPAILNEDKASSAELVKLAQLHKFGQVVLSVISRAFKIDDYYDLGMVPGADLFNHMEPQLNGKNIVGHENIHFICDGSVCGECGEEDCDHEEELEMELDSDTEEIEDEEVDEVQETEFADQLNDADAESIAHGEDDGDDEDDDDEDDEDDDEDEDDDDDSSSEPDIESSQYDMDLESSVIEEEPIKEITMEYIKQMELEMENDSDADTNQDPDEESTVSLEGDEGEEGEDEEEEQEGEVDPEQDELAKELSDSSKCCDVVLVKLPEEIHEHEIFNSYGNELSNPYLLQRYGFITGQNVNDTCLLSVQVFKHIKHIKAGLSSEKQKQLELKFEWFEGMGFDIVNQLIGEHIQKEQKATKACGDKCEDNCDGCEEKDGCGAECEDGCEDGCGEEDDDELELPETWQLSPRINFTGECTLQTYAILTLLDLPFKIFKHKLLLVNKEKKLIRMIKEIFLEDQSSRSAHNAIIKNWCVQRLSGYPVLKPSSHHSLVKSMVEQEKAILQKFIDQ